MARRAATDAYEIRPLRSPDGHAAREMVGTELDRTPYKETPQAALESALDRPGAEYCGVVAVAGHELAGLILYGLVAGTVGAGRIYLVAVTASARLRGVATTLIDAATRDLKRHHARFAVVEFPDDPMLAAGKALLQRAGFGEVARVKDYFRDGVDLTFLRRDLT